VFQETMENAGPHEMDLKSSESDLLDMRVFQGVEGKGVRVAVVDSGVNPHHFHVKGVEGGIAIGGRAGRNEYLDSLGHGTAVVAAIKEKVPLASIYAVKIYHDSLRTDVSSLCEALDWSIDQKMSVVNLSLGTSNVAHHSALADLVRRANEAGVLLVAAADVGDVTVLPGSLPGVIGVGLDWSCPRDVFRCVSDGRPGNWRASGYPRSLPGMHPRKNLHGVSFATANMSGFVVRAREVAKSGSFADITELLRVEAGRIEQQTTKKAG
jgi:subtilisin family serine protease